MGLLSSWFSKVKVKHWSYFGYKTSSAPWNKAAWEHELFRGIVDCIATHVAKGEARHVVVDEHGRIKKVIWNSSVARLINTKPNSIMSGFDLKYRLCAQLQNKTTAIAYVDWKDGKPQGIYPVDYEKFEFHKIAGGGYAIVIQAYMGEVYTLLLEDCIVVRKFYADREVAGDGNAPIYRILDMAKASDEGFVESLTVANKVRGLLKNTKGMLASEDVKKSQEEFAARVQSAAENGGIVAMDGTQDYTPLEIKSYAANAAQMKEISNRMHTYMRTSEAVVQSKYSEQEGMAWYESVIEPIWQQFSEAITNALFTDRERGHGNKIIFSGGMLLGSSYQTRVNVITSTKEIALLTINEQRELLGYAPIEGGDVRLYSKNFASTDELENQEGGNDGSGDEV